MRESVRRTLPALFFAACSLAGCSKHSSGDPGGATAGSPGSPSPASPAATASAAPAGGEPVTCTKYATLDMAMPPRPPLVTTVQGARVPNGGTPKAKNPALYSIEYFQPGTPPVEVACALRKQLETDKWTIESMTGSSPVAMIARKGKAGVQVMVGPGSLDALVTAILTVHN
jgi:hypothetical protein